MIATRETSAKTKAPMKVASTRCVRPSSRSRRCARGVAELAANWWAATMTDSEKVETVSIELVSTDSSSIVGSSPIRSLSPSGRSGATAGAIPAEARASTQ